MNSEALKKIENSHAMYCDYNQSPRSDCEWMAANGHPQAEAYKRLRAYFDSLKYACNSRARRISYRDSQNRAEYWAPELSVTWHAHGFMDRFWGEVYPAHAQWGDYLAAIAEAGWPEDRDPSLRTGTFYIYTDEIAMIRAVAALGLRGVSVDDENGIGSIQISNQDAADTLKVIELIESFHGDCLLPKRTDSDDAADQAPLPMDQKRFALANVERVTISDRKVLVPLVPFGDNAAVQRNVNGLVDALAKGFRWEQCCDYLKDFLKPKAYRQLERQYGR